MSFTPGKWEYKDLIAVLLTVVTIVLAFIGFIIAGAAIWGYQSLRSIAEDKAEKTSKAGFEAYLKSDVFNSLVTIALKERIISEAKGAVQDALAPVVLRSDDAPEYHDQQGALVSPDTTLGENLNRGDEEWQD
jgi:hypothetical protein